MNLLLVDDVGRFTAEYMEALPPDAITGFNAINVLDHHPPSHVNNQIQMAINGFPSGKTLIAWTSTELALEVVEEILETDEPFGMVVSKGIVDENRPLREHSFRRGTILPEHGPDHNRGILNVFWVDSTLQLLDEDSRSFAEILLSWLREKELEPYMIRTRDFKIHEGSHGEFEVG